MIQNRIRPWALALLVAFPASGLSAAQDGRPIAPEHRSAEDELAAKLATLGEEYRAARRAAREAARDAASPAERAAALRINPWASFAPRYETLAQEAEGTAVAASAWATILMGELGYGAPAKAVSAFKILVYDHPHDEVLAEVLPSLVHAPIQEQEMRAGLRNVIEVSERRAARAHALHVLAQRMSRDPDADSSETLALYRALNSEYGDVVTSRGSTLAQLAEPAIYELEHLRVGMSVPDFESADETGTAFRLSEYEGKVVLLDFWGFW